MQRRITFGSKEILFTLSWQKRKTLSIKVLPDSSVEVTAPESSGEDEITKKVQAKAPWILSQINHFDSFNPRSRERKFVNSETHLYLGRQYRLKIIQSEKAQIKAYRGQLIIESPAKDIDALKLSLDQWYKAKALVVYEQLLVEALQKFSKYKLQRPVLYIRRMSKRWGSCTPKGKIILNTELIKAPKGCIEYVIVHELVHLIHHNHKKAFYLLLNKTLPDWAKRKDRLEHCLS